MPPTVAWPSPGDYSTAIQNPQNCFNDPELRTGRPLTNNLGLPIGMSGNFAVVYQLTAGAKKYAVRCFIRQVTDQWQRYNALSGYMSGLRLPWLTDFVYLPQGIRVSGEWRPVVRMEWVSGKQLQRYVSDNLRQSQTLSRLAAQWRGMVAALSGAHTAHGDLQHGNILVDGSEQLRLVDYDGFFLRTLHSQPPSEVGHPNYQHPERLQKGYYAENGDAFSALVIYLSLLALQADSGLWQFHNGENLIFRADDFERPGKTPTWSRLHGSSDAPVKQLTAALEGFCRGAVAAVPDLETVVQHLPSAPISPTSVLPRSRPTPTPPPSTAVVCPGCGYANATAEIYCQHCARILAGERPSSRCGHPVPQNALYCPECGVKV